MINKRAYFTWGHKRLTPAANRLRLS